MEQEERTCKEGRPLSLAAYLLTGLALLGLVVGFAVLCRGQYLRMTKVDVSQLDEPCPQNLRVVVSGNRSGEDYLLEGYALLDGERLEWVDCFVALCDTTREGEDNYFRLPTTMTYSEEAAALQTAADGRAGYAGFGAYLRGGCLSGPPQAYEVCLLYRTNHHRILVHTGKTLQEVVA